MQRWILEIVCRVLQWRGLSAALVALWLLGGKSAHAQPIAQTPYFTNFESGTPAGWSVARFNTQATLTRFLGNFGRVGNTQESAVLTLQCEPNTRYTLIFDLYLIDTWDAGDSRWGPDSFTVTEAMAGTLFNRVLYSSHSPNSAATYPAMWDQSGRWFGSAGSNETLYRSIVVRFTSSSSVIALTFRGGANEALSNESWAIDNVRVIETRDEGNFVPRFVNVGRFRTFEATTTTSTDWGSSPTWADLSRNGTLDALISGTATRQMRYNRTNGRFTATTLNGNFARQARIVDLDADGDLDIFGFQDVNGERFLLSNGAGAFTSVGDLGLSSPTNNRGLIFLDTNADGFPDPLILSGATNWLGTNSGLDPTLPAPAMSATTTPITMAASAPEWLNSAGSSGATGGSVASGDVNDDGVPDFMHQLGYGVLYLSQSGGGWARTETSIRLPLTSERLGMQWADLDRDGDLDLLVANPIGAMQAWINDGGVFVERAASLGLVAGVNTRSVAAADYTNDGRLDVYAVAANGEGNVMFRGGPTGFSTFNDRAANAGVVNLDAAFGDYDGDGDLDLAVTTFNSAARLFDNVTDNDAYLRVRFIGMGPDASNGALRCGTGVSIRLYDATGTLYLGRRELGAARGLASSEPLMAHFGGVNPALNYVVKVRARGRDHSILVRPSAATSIVNGATLAQTLTIDEADLKPALKVTRWREVSAAE